MVTVVVPWRPGCPDRERAWAWVKAQYELRHPGWRVVEAVAPDGPWCKATAVQPAIEAADAGVVVVADADVWCERTIDAVDAVSSGRALWAIPHLNVRRLTREATAARIAGHDAAGTVERPYPGTRGGGIVVASRDTLYRVPLDRRFVGWGQEDASWGVALHVLCGPAWRGTADLVHLWHPPQERLNRKIGNPDGQLLHRRYLAARRDPRAMRELLKEAR